MPEQGMIRDGWIEVVVGCMFSGKSNEAAKRVEKEMFSRDRTVLIFTPRQGRRKVTITTNGKKQSNKNKLLSRAGKAFKAIEFDGGKPDQIITRVKRTLAGGGKITTVAIEEGHFCAPELVRVCKTLAEKFMLRVIVMGLDKDFRNRGFGPVPGIMVDAERVSKELATCIKCGNPNANNSWLPPRFWNDLRDGNQLPGDAFEPTCRICYHKLVEKYGLPPE